MTRWKGTSPYKNTNTKRVLPAPYHVSQAQRLLGITHRVNDFVIYTAADNTSTFDPSWVFSAGGGPMTVDWGDGSARESHATALTHTYADGSTKAVKFSCPDWSKVTSFDVNNDIGRNNLPSFSRLYNLTLWRGYTNQFSGKPPSFAACTLLTLWSGNSNQFSGYEAGSFATQGSLATLSLQINSLPAAAIDAILADLVTSLGIGGRVVCTVNLSGAGNAAPSDPEGLANKATLVAAGWTVTTN